MKYHPIIFSSEMVRAILENRKSQTRRVVKPQPDHKQIHYWKKKKLYEGENRLWWWKDHSWDLDFEMKIGLIEYCPYGKVGDRLWVRETWCLVDDTEFGGTEWIDYRATPKHTTEHPAGWENEPQAENALKWKPSIHMPRWASRITLEITDIRVERLQEISFDDIYAEGIRLEDREGESVANRQSAFLDLWNSIHKKEYRWEDNPFVWVIGFKKGEDKK